MKHTPGPWEVLEGQGCAKVRQITPTPCVSQLRSIVYGVNWRHDAHLIAAAPDMLEALEGLVSNLEELLGAFLGTHSMASVNTLQKKMLSLPSAVDSIRKAKGEQEDK